MKSKRLFGGKIQNVTPIGDFAPPRRSRAGGGRSRPALGGIQGLVALV